MKLAVFLPGIGYTADTHEIVPETPYTKAEMYDFSGKTIVPFATSGSSGIGDSGKNIGEIAKGSKVDAGKRFPANASQEELKEWAGQFRPQN